MKLMLFRLTILVIISLTIICCNQSKKQELKTTPVVDFKILNNSLDSISMYILESQRVSFNYKLDTLFIKYRNLKPKNFLERCDRVVFGDDFNISHYSRFKNTSIYNKIVIDESKVILDIFKVCKFESYYLVEINMWLGSRSVYYEYLWDREENTLISKEFKYELIE